MRNLPIQHNFFNVVDDLFRGSLQETFNRGETLAVDIKEYESEYIIHADVPGISKENIKVSFDKGSVSIEVSERKNNETKEGEKVLRSERFFSKKYRSFNFGDKVDEANIEAEYKDGVLTLTLPKKESAKVVRQIEVK